MIWILCRHPRPQRQEFIKLKLMDVSEEIKDAEALTRMFESNKIMILNSKCYIQEHLGQGIIWTLELFGVGVGVSFAAGFVIYEMKQFKKL